MTEAPEVPESAKEKLAYVKGLGLGIRRIQEYASELFLRDLGEVEAVRLRDLAIDLNLIAAKIVSDAHEIEDRESEEQENNK